MGKGDKKTRRGKINRGTFGVRRPRGKKVTVTTVVKKKVASKKTAKPEKAAKVEKVVEEVKTEKTLKEVKANAEEKSE